VNDHDCPGPEVPRAHPYGIYDLAKNTGWVSVGPTHDTASFAVASIWGWWKSCGGKLYPKAKRLLITADAGGSNGSRLRLWKGELQRLADETVIPIRVCHFPPGISKWNKIEHGSVAKLIVTLCYPQSVVFFTFKHFNIWYSPKTLRQSLC
jgi:hypothetical protein